MADDTQPPSNHNVYAAWLFGSILLLFYLGVFIFAPDQLPEFKHRMLGIISALLCGLFAFFLVGALQLSLKLKSKGQKLAVQGSGGLAAFGLILIWWNYSSFAPVSAQPNITTTQQNTLGDSSALIVEKIDLKNKNFIQNTKGKHSPAIISCGDVSIRPKD